MSKTQRFSRTLKTRPQVGTWVGPVAVLGLLLLVTLALAGCVEAPAIAGVEPTATNYPPPPTDIPAPPPGPTPQALDFPLAAPTKGQPETASDQSCVDCHTDEETLEAVAEKEDESEESLSEGEG
jgi:hypothetical protein